MPVLEPGYTYGSVTDKISAIVLTQPTPRWWFVGFAIGFMLSDVLFCRSRYSAGQGRRHLGHQHPGGWGFAIINFVWWIGIGHAGTLISAILLLLHQNWRTSINRFAEAMTLFAVACAGHVSAVAHGPALVSSTGCSRIPTRWACGRNSAARWSGTCSR